jgi:hypothetical protein
VPDWRSVQWKHGTTCTVVHFGTDLVPIAFASMNW